ncbi:hypothetical protein FOZ62_002754, partial [Perkinsus olseni]
IVRTRYDSAVCLASIEASNSELIPFLLDDLSQMTLARLEIWDGNLFWHQASKDRRYVSSMRACFRLPLLFLVILIIREEVGQGSKKLTAFHMTDIAVTGITMINLIRAFCSTSTIDYTIGLTLSPSSNTLDYPHETTDIFNAASCLSLQTLVISP